MTRKLLVGAFVLASIAIVGSAAQAAPPSPSFSFGLNSGGGINLSLGQGNNDDDCLDTRSIVADLRQSGYRHFTNFDNSDGDSFTVDTQRGTRWYELTVDSCSGEILDRTRIRFPG